MKRPSIIRKLIRSQKGFTLVELIIAIAIAGIIGAAATMAVHHMIAIPTISNESNTAINQVRNAVYWISRDAVMANNVDDSPTGGEFLKLTWDSYDGSSHNCTYDLLPSSDGLKKLQRDYDGQLAMIAQYIKPVSANVTECSWDAINSMLTVTITATVGDETETRTFEVKPRPID